MPGLLPAAGMNAWCQQEALGRLDAAFRAFFARVQRGETPGFPRFKSANRYRTLVFDLNGNGGGLKLDGARGVRVQGVGQLRMRGGRGLPEGARALQAKLTRRAAGRWHLSVVARIPKPEPLPHTGAEVGVDLGVATHAALSTGEMLAGPRAFERAQAELAKAQQRVARRKRGSRRQRKARARVARLHERIANQRRDHAHKTARALIERFDLIALEDLHVKNMTASARGTIDAPGTNVAQKQGLNRSILDQGWSLFRQTLTDKAEEAGRLIVTVNPAHTSQDCSHCGARAGTFDERVYTCGACDIHLDRDVNAARNILDRARRGLADQQESENTLAVRTAA